MLPHNCRHSSLCVPERLRRLFLACLALLAFGLDSNAAAAELQLDGPPKSPIPLSGYAEIHDDGPGVPTPLDILTLAEKNLAAFQPGDAGRGSPAVAGGPRWLRLDIVNTGKAALGLVFVPGQQGIEYTEFLLLDENGTWHRSTGGTSVPLAMQNDFDRHNGRTFRIPTGARVQIQSRTRGRTPVHESPQLFSTTGYKRAAAISSLWDIGIIGGLATLGGFALFMAIIGGHFPFLWLGLLALNGAFHEAANRGFAQRILWPGMSGWGYPSNVYLGGTGLALFALFIRGVARRHSVRIPGLWVLDLMPALLCIALAAAWFLDAHTVWLLLAALGVALGICMLWLAARLIDGSPTIAGLMGISATLALSGLGLDLLARSSLYTTIAAPAGLDMDPLSALKLLATGITLAVLASWANLLPRRERSRGHRLAPSRAHLQEKIKQKNQMLGYISHDLRAPLATIASYARLMDEAATPQQHEHIKAIERSVGYQLGLIDEVLSYTKSELQPLSITPSNTSLPALLEEVVSHGVALCIQKNNTFHFLPPPILPAVVSMDGLRLRQALLNLLGNAAKFTDRGSVTLALQAQRNKEQWTLTFSVEDNGVGIPVNEQAEIFSAFTQLRHNTDGSGLGLFITERIVTGMNGHLRVASAVAAGSRFQFTIPVPAVGDATVAMPPSHVLPPSVADVSTAADPQTPPLSMRLKLARLAREGEISGIQEWLNDIVAEYPSCEKFRAQVGAALRQMDLRKIQALALNGYREK